MRGVSQAYLAAADDGLYALQSTIPRRTRSSWHRCFQRHGISRLPEVAGDIPAKQKFEKYSLGYFHIDIAVVPSKMHTVSTDNGTQFTELAHFRRGAAQQQAAQHPEGLYLMHAFDDACERNQIEHRLTKHGHLWTNGQVERMNRTLKEATVNRYYDANHSP